MKKTLFCMSKSSGLLDKFVIYFIYGSSYFRFHEPYGLNNTYNALGYYMLSVKWWNIEFNWCTYKNKWQVDIKLRFIRKWKPRRYKEVYVIFNGAGVRTYTLNIY